MDAARGNVEAADLGRQAGGMPAAVPRTKGSASSRTPMVRELAGVLVPHRRPCPAICRTWMLLVVLAAGSAANAEVRDDYAKTVATEKRDFTVGAGGPSSERYQATWTARLNVFREQTGQAAYWDRWPPSFFDTRRCTWTIEGWVERQFHVCGLLIGCAAEVVPNERIREPTRRLFTSKERFLGKPVTIRLHPENCGMVEGRFKDAVSAKEAELVEAFEREVPGDRRRVMAIIEHLAGAVKDGAKPQ